MSGSDSTAWGGVRIGDLALALPLAALREVVACTGPLRPLPCDADSIAGGLDLRGVTVPVLDLGRAIGRPPRAGAPPAVLVLVHGPRIIGLACDGVLGVFRAEPGSHTSACPTEVTLPMLFDGSLRRADSGELLALLSLDGLAALPDVPWIRDPEPARQLRHDASAAREDMDEPRTAAKQRSLMLLRCSRTRLAVDATAVHATLWQPSLQASVLARGHCRGVVDIGPLRAAALDLATFAGLTSERNVKGQAVVLRRPEGLVALLVDEIADVVRVPAAALVPGAPPGLPRPELFDAMYRHDTLGDHLVVDAQALLADAELASLASTNVGETAPSGEASHGGTPSGAGRALLTACLPAEVALLVDQVEAILPCDGGDAGLDTGSPVRGMRLWRGHALTVVCLVRLLGHQPVAPDGLPGALLVVRSDKHRFGLRVPRLRAITRAKQEFALPSHHGGSTYPVVTLDEEDRRTLPLLDLRQLVGRLVVENAPPAATA